MSLVFWVKGVEFPWTPDIDRTPGPHVTDIVEDYLRKAGVVKGEEEDVRADPVRMQFEKGYLWETMLTMAWREHLGVRPGEVEQDGIIGSPDGLGWMTLEDVKAALDTEPGAWLKTIPQETIEEVTVDNGVMAVEEYKCTASSLSKSPLDHIRWTMQTKAYCYMTETNWVRFRNLYLCGDYRAIRWPVYREWLVWFSDEEVIENWRLLRNHLETMEFKF